MGSRISPHPAPSGSIHKKMLDVWSIYQCVRCAYTWNISLFSRLPVSKINPQLYERFSANDKSAVEAYSHDLLVLRRNRASPSGSPEFVVKERWRINLVRASQVKWRSSLRGPFKPACCRCYEVSCALAVARSVNALRREISAASR